MAVPPLDSRSPSAERSLGRGARARILAAADALFSSQGFNATSINDLRERARVSKRTLYQQFASKDELILAHLAERERGGAAVTLLAREQLAPRTRLLELFTTLAEQPQRAGPDAFLAAAAEFPDPAHPAHRAALEHHRRFCRQLGDLARGAGARDPDRLGRQLALLYAGAASAALIEDPARVVSDAYAMAATLVREAID